MATIIGSSGDDEFLVDPNSLSQGSVVDGGAGFDVIRLTDQFSGFGYPVSIDLSRGLVDGRPVQLRSIEALYDGKDRTSTFIGDAQANLLVGDFVTGDGGNDTLEGGTAVYAGEPGAVEIVLLPDRFPDTGRPRPLALAIRPGEVDVLRTTGLQLGDGNDLMRSGDPAFDPVSVFLRVDGGGGDDVLIGRSVDGGPGNDTITAVTAIYDEASGDVWVSLALGIASDAAGTDRLIGVHDVIGSSFSDWLEGDAGDNRLEGRRGDDVLFGGIGDDTLVGGGGRDLFAGGPGFDVADLGDPYDWLGPSVSGSPILASLVTGRYETQGYGGFVEDIEGLYGGKGRDTLIGDDSANLLAGVDGIDSLAGGAGNDTLIGGSAADTLDGGAGDDVLYGRREGDSTSYTERDLVLGGEGNDWITAWDGGDTLLGGPGIDRLLLDGPPGETRFVLTGGADYALRLTRPYVAVGLTFEAQVSQVERLVFTDRCIAFGERAVEVAKLAVLLWNPGALQLPALLGKGVDWYDSGQALPELIALALSYFSSETDAQLATRLVGNSRSGFSVAELQALLGAGGGGEAARLQVVQSLMTDAATLLTVDLAGMRTQGLSVGVTWGPQALFVPPEL